MIMDTLKFLTPIQHVFFSLSLSSGHITHVSYLSFLCLLFLFLPSGIIAHRCTKIIFQYQTLPCKCLHKLCKCNRQQWSLHPHSNDDIAQILKTPTYKKDILESRPKQYINAVVSQSKPYGINLFFFPSYLLQAFPIPSEVRNGY